MVVAGAGDYFQRAWCQFIEDPPQEAKERIRSWDLASTKPGESNRDPDWTVGVLMSRVGKVTVLEHMIERRDTPGQIKDLIIRTAHQDRETWGRMVKIRLAKDPGQAGKAQIDDLVAALDGFTVLTPRETGDKEVRAGPFSSAAEHNLVKIVQAPWNDRLCNELEMFPRGKHDDHMDAVSGGFNSISGRELPPADRRPLASRARTRTSRSADRKVAPHA